MNSSFKQVIIAAGALAVLTACSGTSTPGAAVVSVSTPEPASAPTASVSIYAPASTTQRASGSPTPTIVASSTTAGGGVPIGSAQTATIGELSLTVTAHGLKALPPGEFSILSEGSEYTGLDAEVCGNFAGTVTGKRWTLLDGTNGRYRPETFTGEDLAPKYPSNEENLAANECVRGWIMFETVTAQPVTTVRYETGDSSVILKWDVPADQG